MIPSRLAILRAASPWQRFMNNRPGVVYTPHDRSTLRSARSSGPWNGVNVGSLVGAMRDVSRAPGLGNDAIAASDSSRMTLESFGSGTGAPALRANGSSTAMQSSLSVDLSASSIATAIVVVRKIDGVTAIVLETSANFSSVNGAFYVANAEQSADDFSCNARANVTPAGFPRITGLTVPSSAVLIAKFDLAQPLRSLSANRGSAATNTSSMGAGNFAAHILNIGSRNAASLYFNGQVGTIALIGGPLSQSELDTAVALATGPYGI